MNFINRNLQQVQQLFLSMSMAARITTGLLLVAIVVSLSYLAVYQVGSGDLYIYGGREFSQSELAAMTDALGKAGLNDYEHVGNRLRIPRHKRDVYVRAISEAGATPRFAHELDETQTSFNPLLSQEQQRNLVKTRMQSKLQKMIMELDGIEQAAVMFNESETKGFPRRVDRTAAITAKAAGTRALTGVEVNAIRNLARSLDPGLKDDDITVVDGNTKESHRGVDDPLQLTPERNPYVATARMWEEEFREKIMRRLRAYDPNVEVFVDIDETIRKKTVAKTLDSTPVVVEQEAENSYSRNVDVPPGGVPGVTTNNPPPSGANGTATVGNEEARESSEDSTSESSKSVVGGTVSESEIAGMIPRSVRVSIGIPIGFYKRIWSEANPPAEGEDPQPMTQEWLEEQEAVTQATIEDAIKTLIPQVTKGEDIIRFIDVQTDPELPETVIPEPTMTEGAFGWLANNWHAIGMLLIGLAGLVMLRGMIKSSTPPLPDEEEEQDSEQQEEAELAQFAADPTAFSRLQRKFGSSGKSLQEELTELVEEDVEAAASVLRTWIGDLA